MYKDPLLVAIKALFILLKNDAMDAVPNNFEKVRPTVLSRD